MMATRSPPPLHLMSFAGTSMRRTSCAESLELNYWVCDGHASPSEVFRRHLHASHQLRDTHVFDHGQWSALDVTTWHMTG